MVQREKGIQHISPLLCDYLTKSLMVLQQTIKKLTPNPRAQKIDTVTTPTTTMSSEEEATIVPEVTAAEGTPEPRQMSLHDYMKHQKGPASAAKKQERVTTSPQIDAMPSVGCPKPFEL